MSFILTYTSLLETVRQYLERGDVNDQDVFDRLPQLIAFAEKRLAKEIKPQGFERYLVSTMQVGVAVYQKPDRWRETRSITIGTNATASATGFNTRVPLFPRELEYLQTMYWPNPTVYSVDEPPRFYADYGYNNILIAPTPAVAYPFQWAIWQELQPLDEANQTNWLTQIAPEVLTYAVLLEAQPFLKNDARIPVWQGIFDRGISGLLTQDARKAQDAAVKPEEGVQ